MPGSSSGLDGRSKKSTVKGRSFVRDAHEISQFRSPPKIPKLPLHAELNLLIKKLKLPPESLVERIDWLDSSAKPGRAASKSRIPRVFHRLHNLICGFL